MATESRMVGNISAMLVVIIMIISGTVMSHHHPEHSETPQSQPKEDDQDPTEFQKTYPNGEAEKKYFESLPGEFREYASNCAKQISRECGEEIFGSILNKVKVSTICCHDLVEMGLECHNALVKVVSGLPKYKHMAVQITGNSRQVFNHCVEVDN